MATASEGEGTTAEVKPRQTPVDDLAEDSKSIEVSRNFSINFNWPNQTFTALNK